jgi:uncharacterized BrkB/YihY/UPF0761 family membrane protein
LAFCGFSMDSRFYVRLFIVIVIFVFAFQSFDAFACPGCIGSLGKKNDQFTVWGLSIFILATYIPMSMLYRMIYKHRKLNSASTPEQ